MDVRVPMSTEAIRISIIVTVYNSAQLVSECVAALIAAAGPNSEIIVVDDASTDNTPLLAAQAGARVLRLTKNSGPPGTTRNYGVRHSKGDILFFVDADVVVRYDAIRRVSQVFDNNPGIAALFGSYNSQPRAKGVVSQYRNLLHHFVHQNGNQDASTFWAGCGAIRRSVFEELGLRRKTL
jgi:glycosyltransferase involved in cell wall biosynthesis